MKTNVDLTKDNIFSRRNLIDVEEVRQELASVVGIRLIESSRDLVNPENEVYYTGNSTDRRLKRYYLQDRLNELYCDCCGKQLIYVPWRNNLPLCENCDRRLTEEINEKPLYELPSYQRILEEQKREYEIQRPLDNIFLWD